MQDITQNQNQTTPAQANPSPEAANSLPQQAGRIIEPPEISGHKEHGPISQAKTEFAKPVEAQPEIAPSTPEITIPPELEKTIEKSTAAEEPKIEKNTPAKLAKESTPVITAPTGLVRLPMTYQEALQKEKKSAFWDSMHWLAAQIIYQFRKNEKITSS